MVGYVQQGRGGGAYRLLLYAFFLSLLVSAGLLALNCYQFIYRPNATYAATRSDGVTQPLQTYSSPVLTYTQIVNWAQRAIIASNTFGFVTWETDLTRARQFYSAAAWDAFTRNLKSSGVMRNVLEKKTNMQAVATSQASASSQAFVNGRYLYLIHMPILTQYMSSPDVQSIFKVVTVRVQKENDTLRHPKGVSVVNYSERKGVDPRAEDR